MLIMNTGVGGLDIDISRSASQMTLDSIDQITRYSEVRGTYCVSKSLGLSYIVYY